MSALLDEHEEEVHTSIAFPRYWAAVSASCGSRGVAMSFRVAAGLMS